MTDPRRLGEEEDGCWNKDRTDFLLEDRSEMDEESEELTESESLSDDKLEDCLGIYFAGTELRPGRMFALTLILA
jgi:hypothetical protein